MEVTPIITKEDIVKLLGRPLSAKEDAGYDAYLEIAQVQLEDLLGYSLELSTAITSKTFTGVDGYRSIFTPPFTEISSVSIDGKAIGYTVGTTNKPIKVEIVLERPAHDNEQIVVSAKWGYATALPGGVKLLLSNMFAVVANGQATGSDAKVKSETTLSHSVSYDNSSTHMASFEADNANIISLYQRPKPGELQAGRILWGDDDDLSGYSPYF